MTLTIPLSPEAEARLQERAIAAGQDVTAYAAQLLEEAITSPTVDELLAPFRRQVEQSGMSDEELDAFYEELRDKVWQERQAKQA